MKIDDTRTAPLIAALAAIAAGTLVAVTVLGQSLGPVPIDNPALALLPGSGTGAPLIVNIPAEPAPPAAPSGPATTGQPVSAPAATDNFLPSTSRTGFRIDSIAREERTEPVPPQHGVAGKIQRRVAELTRSWDESSGPMGAAHGLHAGKKGWKDKNHKKKDKNHPSRKGKGSVKGLARAKGKAQAHTGPPPFAGSANDAGDETGSPAESQKAPTGDAQNEGTPPENTGKPEESPGNSEDAGKPEENPGKSEDAGKPGS